MSNENTSPGIGINPEPDNYKIGPLPRRVTLGRKGKLTRCQKNIVADALVFLLVDEKSNGALPERINAIKETLTKFVMEDITE